MLWIASLLSKIKDELVWVNKNEERNRENQSSSVVEISNQLFSISGSVDSIEKEIKRTDEEKKKARKEEKKFIEEIANAENL